ncbi:MAG: biotin/lipoyl-binding protein, partial [Firmicutes bacterium]|nr:biotin/lipoyl-binding protein [Bacillota bacterium]
MKKKREKRSMALLAAAIAAALFVSGCSSDEAAPPEVKYTAVETMTAETGTLKDEFAYSGKVTPSREINVMSAVAGKVSRVNYAVGDYVEEGAVLFSLEKTDVQNNINVLTAGMSAAEANIAVSQISLDTAQDALEKNKTL